MIVRFGDGGMVVTNDPDRAERLKILPVHGSKRKYYHRYVGGNFRLDAIQAEILSVKLKHLDTWTAKRQVNAAMHDAAFQSSGLIDKGFIIPPKPVWKGDFSSSPGSQDLYSHFHIYNQYVIATPKPDELRKYFSDKGIGTEIYYPVPLHLQECFSGPGYLAGSCPVSEKAARETLALLIYPELTPEQQEHVVNSIREF